jgi:penicillin-binding protein 1C
MTRRTMALGGAALILAALGLWLMLTQPAAPPFAAVRAAHGPSDARLLDRHGAVLDARRIDATRRRLDWVPLAQISPALRGAIIAVEDHRFREHDGVDVRAVAAAIGQALRGGPSRGASTITMQVAALIDPRLRPRGGTRSLVQKWGQARLARAIERTWSKDEILEAYLNRVGFRGELEGVGAAAAALFATTPGALTGAESAVMAALVAAPGAPPDAVVRRVAALRTRLPEPPAPDALDAAAHRALAGTPVVPSPRSLAPHLAQRLLGTAAVVDTTLDARLQRAAVAALEHNLLAVRDRGVQDGALLVVDNETGDVLAYVGSSGRLSTARHVDGVRARRQAGSALKPFLYGLAIERRLLTPAALLEDAPLEIALPAGLYRPHDYDERFLGLVSVRTALASSLNTPAVRALGLVGGDAFVAELGRLGFAGVDRSADYYGPALALGSADVSLWEMVGAYRALANRGRWTPLRLRSDDRPGASRQALEPATAFLVADMLADRESRSATFGLENALATRFWTAVKTGTSTDMRDNWCIGFSRRFTVGVWVGNFSGAPMRDVSGVTGAAPVWLEVMELLHAATPSEPPPVPLGVVAVPVVFAGDVEPPRREWMLAGSDAADAHPSLAPARPRVRSPVSGTRFALDPDVPPARQRLLLEAEHVTGSPRWRMDGVDLGAAGARRLWEPTPGRHLLELVDAAGNVQDQVAFEVRGRTAR